MRFAPGDGRLLDIPGLDRVVALVRATRDHPEIRIGSSVRGAIDMVVAARAVEELLVLAPVGGEETGARARSLARTVGAAHAEVTGPHSIPAAIAAVWP